MDYTLCKKKKERNVIEGGLPRSDPLGKKLFNCVEALSLPLPPVQSVTVMNQVGVTLRRKRANIETWGVGGRRRAPTLCEEVY